MWLIGIGILGALAAALLGLSTIERSTPAHKTGLAHMVLNPCSPSSAS